MQAAIRERYGTVDVLELREVDRPTPAEGEILVRVVAASVNRLDLDGISPRPGFTRAFLGLRPLAIRVSESMWRASSSRSAGASRGSDRAIASSRTCSRSGWAPSPDPSARRSGRSRRSPTSTPSRTPRPCQRRSTGLMLWWKPFDRDDLATVEKGIAAGKVKPVIDRRFPLSEIVEALRYVDEGRPRGMVIIEVAGPG
jgi:NADPH:quinone reductase-like Zn-dependent oxidoreductase